MKLRIKKDFYDKYTREKHTVGKVIEVDEKRGNEILSSEYKVAELIVEPKAEADELPKPKPKKKSEK